GKREVKASQRRSPLAFLVSGVQVSQGKIHYIDRSSKEPVEIRVRNLELNLKGLGLTQTASIELAANLLEGQGQNVTLEGQIGPFTSVKDWRQFPLDLQMGIDSLPFSQLTRAVPFLKEKIPSYLDTTGPLMLKARVMGTVDRPHIIGLTLTGPFFGSPSNNVKVTADLDLSNRGLWTSAAIKGEITVEPVSLDSLKKIPFVERLLPASLISQGPLGLASEVEGNLQDLKVHALIKSDKSEIRYGKWLKKPKGTPAQLEIRAIKKKDRLILEKSTLSFHNLKLEFSGSLEQTPERVLRLRIRTDSVDLSGWERLLIPASPYDITGKLRFDLWIEKMFSPQGDNLDVRGYLNLNELRAKDEKSGRAIERIKSWITFQGKEAEIENLELRLGTSDLTFRGVVRNLTDPKIRYTLRAPKLNLVDLTNLPQHKSDWIKDLISVGEIQLKNWSPSIQASLSLGEGRLQKVPYRNLKGEITWRPERTSFKNLSFQALGGSFRGNGTWESKDGKSAHFTLDPTIKTMDLKALLSYLAPEFSDHVEGALTLNAKLKGSGKDWTAIKRAMRGEGKVEVQGGALKDFNLVEGVLSRVTGLPGIGNLISKRLSPRYATIFKRNDTPFDTLEASFKIGDGRISAKNLILATADYVIQGRGWVGFDKVMRWSATLGMSSDFTQELMQRHENVRYLADDQDRLSVPFRLEGTLPQVRPKPDIKSLAGLIQRGLLRKGMERALGGKKSKKKKDPREWILKGLEQLLGK
ncbi:MAG: AsmA-like C-terminal region-containing protein, partial [Candidatus Binatia bacterium]